jgi:large subunit ribosomal protein L11
MAAQKSPKVSRRVTLELEAGNAAMVDIGKMLGPTGVNTRQLKLDYDEATASQRGDIVPVVVTVFEDRSYAVRYRTPPTAHLIRRVLGLPNGAAKPGSQVVAKISRARSFARWLCASSRTSTPPMWRRRCGRSPGRPAPWGWSSPTEPLRPPATAR